MRKLLYQTIIAQLSRIQVDDQGKYYTPLNPPLGNGATTAIRHFDIWNNQLQFLTQEKPFHLPAVFIEFNPIQWEQQTNGIRQADLSFTLHIITIHHPPSYSDNSKCLTQLYFFDLIDAINASLFQLMQSPITSQPQTFNNGFFGKFVSTQSETDHNHAELIDSKETYTVHITDHSAVSPVITAPATPIINLH